jgi:hypothetical protein
MPINTLISCVCEKGYKKTLKELDPNTYQYFYPFPESGLSWQLVFLLKLVISKHLNRKITLPNMLVSSGMKTCPAYLRYYLIETVNQVKNQCCEFTVFYYKKCNEVNAHQHKRALAFTVRKFV